MNTNHSVSVFYSSLIRSKSLHCFSVLEKHKMKTLGSKDQQIKYVHKFTECMTWKKNSKYEEAKRSDSESNCGDNYLFADRRSDLWQYWECRGNQTERGSYKYVFRLTGFLSKKTFLKIDRLPGFNNVKLCILLGPHIDAILLQ